MKKTLSVCLVVLLSGCMVGPNYKKPHMDISESFVESKKTEAPLQTDLSNWWKEFHDPLLDDYIHQALVQNYDIKIAKEKICELRALYRLEAANLFPKIDGAGKIRKIHISKNLFAPGSPIHPLTKFFQIGFDASWELDFFGKLRRSKQSALYSLQASDEELRNTQITIMGEVAHLYVQARFYQNSIAITKKVISNFETLYQLMNDKYNAGLADGRMVMKIKADLEKARASLPLLIAEKKKTIYFLTFLLGQKMETIQKDFENVASMIDASGKIPSFLPSDLLERRPDIRQAERELAAQTARIGVAKADLFPQFSLVSSYSFLSQKSGNWLNYDSRNWYVGPDLKWPIFYFGRIRANIRMETSKQKQAFWKYEKTVLDAIQEVESSLADYYNQEESNTFSKEQFLATKNEVALQEDVTQSGIQDYSTLLSMQITLYEREKSHVENQAKLATKLIFLYKALGGDWQCFNMP